MTLSIEEAAVAYVQAVRAHEEAKAASWEAYRWSRRDCKNRAEWLKSLAANPIGNDFSACGQCANCRRVGELLDKRHAAGRDKGVAWKRLKKACAI